MSSVGIGPGYVGVDSPVKSRYGKVGLFSYQIVEVYLIQGLPAALQTDGPIPGKKKNCTSWAEYEAPGTSSTAAMCHGGRYNGSFYQPCPSRHECRTVTIDQTRRGPSLPILNPTGAGMGLRSIASQRPIESTTHFRPMNFGQSTLPAATGPQQRQPQQPQRYYESQFSHPVMPPDDYPAAMRTPYASATTLHGGGVSPTFLPREGENLFERLGKNILQGALSACGWHIFDYTRAVDIFR